MILTVLFVIIRIFAKYATKDMSWLTVSVSSFVTIITVSPALVRISAVYAKKDSS